jgi:hypothetical protein
MLTVKWLGACDPSVLLLFWASVSAIFSVPLLLIDACPQEALSSCSL